MTDQVLQDSAVPDSPVPAGSPTGQPNSGETVNLAKQIEELTAQVRALQGDKDRGVHKLTQQVSDLSSRLTDYETYRSRGLSPDEAQRQMRIDQLLQTQEPAPVPQSAPPVPAPGQPSAQNQAGTKVDVGRFLEAMNLDPNGPEAVMLYREGRTSPEALLQFAIEKAAKRPEVNPAQTMPAPSSMAAPSGDLMAEYQQKASKLPRGSTELMKLRAEYRMKGLAL